MTRLLQLDFRAGDPAAELFRQALDLPPDAAIHITATRPSVAETLLIEVWDPFKPSRPEKRYLFCNDPRDPSRITAVTPVKASQLAGLLGHSEIIITQLDATTAAEEYARIEAETPSRETLRNGHPRQYTAPILD